MLHIYFGDMSDSIYNTEVFFKNTYDAEWFQDDFAREIVKKIDKSEILDVNAIKSPVLGIIPPTQLSGGTKTLLLIRNRPDMVFNASTCGDNCAKFILELAKQQDITINLRHIMNFGKGSFHAHILNGNEEVYNMEQMLSVAAKYV